jgi:hypothetical protein
MNRHLLVNVLTEFRDELRSNIPTMQPNSPQFHYYSGQERLLASLITMIGNGDFSE